MHDYPTLTFDIRRAENGLDLVMDDESLGDVVDNIVLHADEGVKLFAAISAGFTKKEIRAFSRKSRKTDVFKDHVHKYGDYLDIDPEVGILRIINDQGLEITPENLTDWKLKNILRGIGINIPEFRPFPRERFCRIEDIIHQAVLEIRSYD